jgi:hypothetical protein
MTQTLQLSPEIIKLQKEVSALEKELGKVILEQDEMVNAIKPNMEAEYQKTVGYKELERMETEIFTRRLKRQVELVQADTTAIETEIDRLVYELYGLTEEEISIVEEIVG